MGIRVLVADDQTLSRQGIRAVLEPERDFDIVGEAQGGREAVTQAVELSPDLVLMDIMMPDGDGIAATRAIKQRCPRTQILMLTVYGDEELFRKAVEAGAAGYVLKDISPTDLARAMRAVHTGKTMINPGVARKMVDHLFALGNPSAGAARRAHGLTEREAEVLAGVAQGLSNKEIATKIFISESTVKTHLRDIYYKLRLRNRAQAAVFAIDKGLVKSLPAAGIAMRTGVLEEP